MASLFNVRLKIKIMTPEDPLVHMEKCKERYRGNKDALEKLDDIATVNSWQEHNGKTGFHSFLSNTPKWVLDIANNRSWITDDEYSNLVGDAQ